MPAPEPPVAVPFVPPAPDPGRGDPVSAEQERVIIAPQMNAPRIVRTTLLREWSEIRPESRACSLDRRRRMIALTELSFVAPA
jgi:hypothetical protein